MFASRIMVRMGSAMTKKAAGGGGGGGGVKGEWERSWQRFHVTCASSDDGGPPLLDFCHLGAALGLVRHKRDSEEHHSASDGERYVVACARIE
jgi:hypothetical protein